MRGEISVKKILPVLLLLCLLPLVAFGADGTASVELLAETAVSWDGNPLPAYPEGQPKITVLRITVPPGTSLPSHRHPVINAGVLLEGELTVVTEEEELFHLKAGQAIVEVVDKWHYGRNDGDVPAVTFSCDGRASRGRSGP